MLQILRSVIVTGCKREKAGHKKINQASFFCVKALDFYSGDIRLESLPEYGKP